MDGSNLATDQKAGGSSPSERARSRAFQARKGALGHLPQVALVAVPHSASLAYLSTWAPAARKPRSPSSRRFQAAAASVGSGSAAVSSAALAFRYARAAEKSGGVSGRLKVIHSGMPTHTTRKGTPSMTLTQTQADITFHLSYRDRPLLPVSDLSLPQAATSGIRAQHGSLTHSLLTPGPQPFVQFERLVGVTR
jgi:hypothetical protein